VRLIEEHAHPMKKDGEMTAPKPRVVMYMPPTSGLPFLAVTVMPDSSVQVEPFPTHDQALYHYVKVAAELHKKWGTEHESDMGVSSDSQL
jgi:hypothetical protein